MTMAASRAPQWKLVKHMMFRYFTTTLSAACLLILHCWLLLWTTNRNQIIPFPAFLLTVPRSAPFRPVKMFPESDLAHAWKARLSLNRWRCWAAAVQTFLSNFFFIRIKLTKGLRRKFSTGWQSFRTKTEECSQTNFSLASLILCIGRHHCPASQTDSQIVLLWL